MVNCPMVSGSIKVGNFLNFSRKAFHRRMSYLHASLKKSVIVDYFNSYTLKISAQDLTILTLLRVLFTC
jgi:hypothetical protein